MGPLGVKPVGSQLASDGEPVGVETGVVETGVVETGVVETGVVETGVVETGVVETGVVDWPQTSAYQRHVVGQRQ